MEPISIQAVAALAFLHLAAIAAAWTTRLAVGSRMEALSQLGCLLAMIVVGAVGCFCCQLELGLSVPSGVTLVIMVLMAVLDFRPTQEPAGRLH
jgi:hypothetical protein